MPSITEMSINILIEGWALWFTGLPGSGKTAVAGEVSQKLSKHQIQTLHLELDRFRREIIPNPQYTSEERDQVYEHLATEAAKLVQGGHNVLIDATGHKRCYRQYARKIIRDFAEVYVSCPLDVCIRRESGRSSKKVAAMIYQRALERQRTGKMFSDLGEVIGIDVAYEETKNPEITIDSVRISPEIAASEVMKGVERLFYRINKIEHDSQTMTWLGDFEMSSKRGEPSLRLSCHASAAPLPGTILWWPERTTIALNNLWSTRKFIWFRPHTLSGNLRGLFVEEDEMKLLLSL
jgi:adenylylsulfate kinase-like enzyme